MLTKYLTPQKSLSKSYLKTKPHREDFENFKIELKKLLETINENESEEHNKRWIYQILSAKKSDPNSDTSKLEAEIDKLVYELYGLTEEEIKIVEESVG